MKLGYLLVCMMLVVGALAAIPASADSVDSESCSVLIDFGDGTVHWADVTVDEEMNAFNVTIEAADQMGITVNYSESDYGILLNGFDGVQSQWPNEFWHFWTWNSSTDQWEIATQGAADVSAADQEAIAWNYERGFPGQEPMATPDNRQPWTSFRHDLSNSGYLGVESPQSSELMWSTNLSNGNIDSSVVTAHGKIYVVTEGIYNWSSYQYEQSPKAYCMDSDGEILWQSEFGGAGYQIGSPLLINDMMIVPSTDGKIYAFDSGNGTLVWSFSTATSWTGVTSSPIIYREQIIFGGGDGSVYSLATNGSLLWKTSIASSIYFSSPAADDGTVYIGSEDGELHAVAANGSGEIWNATVEGKVRSSPLLLEDKIVVTYSMYQDFVAVDGGIAAFSYSGEELWNTTINATSSSPALTPEGIAATSVEGLKMISEQGDIIWELDVNAAVKGSPTVGESSIYIATYEAQSRVLGVDFEGDVIWSKLLEPEFPEHYSMSSPTLTEGVMYVSADNGYVYAFGNLLPTASFQVSTKNLTVFLDANESFDSEGTVEYSWDLDDGNHSEGVTVAHTYGAPGNYTIKLTVTDNEGTQDTVSKKITVTAPMEDQSSNGEIIVGVVLLGGVVVVMLGYILLGKR